jgi:hypothetical protein
VISASPMTHPVYVPDEDALLLQLQREAPHARRACVLAAGRHMQHRLARRLLAALPGPAVYVAVPSTLQESLAHPEAALPPPLLVAGPLDREELAVRIGAIAEGGARLIALDSERLWHARLARALHAADVRLVVVDTSGLAVGSVARWAAIQSLTGRLEDLMPDAHLVLLSPPTPWPSSIDMLVGPCWQCGALVPDAVAISWIQHTSEAERLSSLLSHIRAASGAVLLVAPTRGAAESLAARLREAPLDAAAYHAGLLPAQRAALFTAFREGRLRVLVATEAIHLEAGLPSPALLAFSHPPHSLESLVLLAGRAEHATQGTALVVHTVGGDRAVEPGAKLPTLATVDRLYEALQRRAVHGIATADLFRDRRSVRERSPVLEVGLALLGASGLLKRRSDFARGLTVELLRDDPHALAPVRAVLVLRQGLPLPIDPLHLASQLGWQPHRLHAWLLDAEEQGLVQLRAFGREAVYTVRARTPERSRRLQQLARTLADWQADEARTVQQWAVTRRCRVQALATLLHWPTPDPCGRCDRCRTGPMLSDHSTLATGREEDGCAS